MKFEDLIDKPLDEMTDDDIRELVGKLSVPEINRLEKEIKNKLGRKSKPSKKKKDLEEFDRIVGI